MPLYDQLFARLYDRSLAATEEAGLADRRAHLVGQATGRVLEIGAGTGLNMSHYGPDVDRLVLTEPSEAMAGRLRLRAAQSDLSPEVIVAPADRLPFDDASFDYVVCTLVLCTVDDPETTLTEIKRVLAPGGQLLLLEHVRSEDPARAKWQDRLETPWRIFGNGCRCNRDTEAIVEAAGFEFAELEHGKVRKAPPIVRPLIQGRAVVL